MQKRGPAPGNYSLGLDRFLTIADGRGSVAEYRWTLFRALVILSAIAGVRGSGAGSRKLFFGVLKL